MDMDRTAIDDERIVRLAELASQHGGTPVHPGKPFSLVRAACADMVHRLPSDCRPTLVLLDAKDLAGGLLEAVFGFPRQDTAAATSQLANSILALADDGPIMLAVCMSQPSLETWDRPEQPNSIDIKENELFIRLAENYRLAIVIGGVDLDRADARALITARLHRVLDAALGQKRAGDWNSRREGLREDVETLYRRTAAVLGEGLFAFHFGSTPTDQGRFLQILARLDQFGKRPVEEIQRENRGPSCLQGYSRALHRRLLRIAPSAQGCGSAGRPEAVYTCRPVTGL